MRKKISKIVFGLVVMVFTLVLFAACGGGFDPNTKGAEYDKNDKVTLDYSKTDEKLGKDYKWSAEEKSYGENFKYFMKRAKKIGYEKDEKGNQVAYTIDTYFEGGKMVEKKITYPVRPKRVVSLFESHLNLAWEMGLRNIVGRNSTTAKDVLYDEIVKNKKIQVIGEGAVLASVEKLLALNPDLVLVDAMHTSEETKKKLRDAKIPYVELVSSSVQWYLRSAKLMATIAGRSDIFEKVAQDMVRDIVTVKSAVAQYTKEKGLTKTTDNTDPKNPIVTDNRQRVALTLLEVASAGRNLLGYSDGSANGRIIKTLEGRNLYEGKTNPNAQNPMFATRIPISNEELVKFNPTRVFVQLHGELDEKEMEKHITETFRNNPIYKDLDAVKNNRVYVLPRKLFLYRPNKNYPLVYKYFAEKMFDGINLPKLLCEK